jgi:hypothetical protein
MPKLLGLPKATNDYVAALINKNVFRLEVTMNDTRCMQAFNTLNDFCGVEAGAVRAKRAAAVQLRPKVATKVKILERDISTRKFRRRRIYIYAKRTMAKYRLSSSWKLLQSLATNGLAPSIAMRRNTDCSVRVRCTS